MSFSSDINKFALATSSRLKVELKKQTDVFLVDFLGDDFELILSYEFDQNPNRFHNIKAPDHVIKKLRDAGYM